MVVAGHVLVTVHVSFMMHKCPLNGLRTTSTSYSFGFLMSAYVAACSWVST